MPAPDPPTGTDVAAQILSEHGGEIVKAGLSGELPQAALDAAQDFTGALGDVIGAGRQLEEDRAELTLKRDLLPPDGHRRLWEEAHTAAKSKLDDGQHAAELAYTRLETALRDAALPTFEPGREQLARDEAALALSNGNPEGSALRFASDGNDEAVAALLSPWGKTLLRSRGVTDPERVLADVRKVAVARALDRGDSAAAKALREHFGALGAGKGSAGSQVRGYLKRR